MLSAEGWGALVKIFVSTFPRLNSRSNDTD